MSPTTTERPPIVAVLGHVDHGKSTLLDFIRKENVVSGEFGGITQHVGAYEVVREKNGTKKRITFIDTPGHAAFKAIRARGATVADIAILVVAADDGVKAQTLEALQSIRDAKTPFIVAINKIDKPNADIARTQATLMENEVFLETLGGDVPWVAISAKQGTGIDELLDLILLVAEVNAYTGDPKKSASGFVLEAHRDKKRGIAATLIITDGTLETGQYVRAGAGISPVRILEDHTGRAIKTATFSSPVALVGFDELPDVGSSFVVHKNKKEAEEARTRETPTKQNIVATASTDEHYLLPVIVRADAAGSLEAIELEVKKIGDENRGVSLVQSGIGNISENDVKAAMAASIPPAVVIGFNVGTERTAEQTARDRGVTIENFNIIYKLTERLEELMKERAPRRTVEEVAGTARILKVFSTQKDEHVIGARVESGVLDKNAVLRIERRKIMIGPAKIRNLQSNKQNVSKVETEGEFGAQIESKFAPAVGDMIFAITTKVI